MNQGQLRTYLQTLLGVDTNDQLYTTARLNSLLQQAHNGLVAEIRAANPSYYQKTGNLTSGSRTYNLSSLAPDFAQMLEVKLSDINGADCYPIRIEDISVTGTSGNRYAITGEDQAAVLQTNNGITNGQTLWARWSYWPAAMSADGDNPTGIPTQFHEVVALEALFAFAVGAEQKVPQELRERWERRRRELLAHTTGRDKLTSKVQSIGSRAGMRAYIRTLLGVPDTDQVYTTGRLNMLLEQARVSLNQDIISQAPGWLLKTQTILAASATSHSYTLSTQSPSITDFAGGGRIVELRHTDKDGVKLREVRPEELNTAYDAYSVQYKLTNDVEIVTSDDTDAGINLYLRYTRVPIAWSLDGSIPEGIPYGFEDVVALEALFQLPEASKLGANVWSRYLDRRAQLLWTLGQRSHDLKQTSQVNIEEVL